MYLQNKYTNWYYSLIQTAQQRSAIVGYTENHHIIPRSLGGTNSKINLVRLTAREHFVCHILLTKMTTGNDYYKMSYALHMISNVKNIGEGRYIPNSRAYVYSKKLFKEAVCAYWTDEKRKEHSDKLRTITTGIKRSDETKAKMRNRVWTEKAIQSRLDNCLKSADARKGKPWTDNKRQSTLTAYLEKNLEIALKIIELHDTGISKLKVSQQLGVSWDKVKYSVLHREDFLTFNSKHR